jgi:hypothetical protein
MTLMVDRSQPRHYGHANQAQGRYWSVSQIVEVVAGSKGYADESAMQRGTDLHQIFALHMGRLLGKCDGPDVPPEYDGYNEAIEAWIKQANLQPMMLERSLRHTTLPYAGTVDYVGMVREDYGVLDLKTGQSEKWHRLQLHGYKHLVDKAAKMWVLYIKNDGTFKQVTVKHSSRDWAGFLNGLSILQWREA